MPRGLQSQLFPRRPIWGDSDQLGGNAARAETDERINGDNCAPWDQQLNWAGPGKGWRGSYICQHPPFQRPIAGTLPLHRPICANSVHLVSTPKSREGVVLWGTTPVTELCIKSQNKHMYSICCFIMSWYLRSRHFYVKFWDGNKIVLLICTEFNRINGKSLA